MMRWRMLSPIIGLILAMSAVHKSAAQDCTSFCLQSPGADGPGSCAARCSPGGDLDATRPWEQRTVYYGAIAYGTKSNASGSAYNSTSAEEAKQRAISFCGRYGNDCKVVVSFFDSCAAVAAVEAKGIYNVATNEKRGSAESKALSACVEKNGTGCRIETSICAGP